jgi:uncharacterized membrane protein (DUF4010 family)
VVIFFAGLREPIAFWEQYIPVSVFNQSSIHFAVAIGIGLLIGSERERRKGSGAKRGAAGVRTFALAAFAGALSSYLQSEILLVTVAAGTVLLSALAYKRTAARDPGLTTELALLVTVLLGALPLRNPLLAASLGVITTILLASRDFLHAALKNLLSEQEAHDALVFLAAALVILPLAPDREIGFGAFNPRRILELVVLVMAMSAASYIALRAFGSRLGLPLAGLVGGFISATATIGTMGQRAKRDPALASAATSAAVLANVATVLQMVVVLLVTNVDTCRALAKPLFLSGIAAVAYALILLIRSSKTPIAQEPTPGRAFDVKLAVFFAATVSGILFFCAFLNRTYGNRGLLLGATLSGLADTHATAISIASLVSAGRLTPQAAVLPIVVGFSTNTLTKAVVALTVGNTRFALQLLPGLIALVIAAFLGMWWSGL